VARRTQGDLPPGGQQEGLIGAGPIQDRFLILLHRGTRLEMMLDFERILRDRGYRLTNQRRVIVRELEGERHLSAEELYDRVKGDHPELGLSTVYRTLDLLTELGIVRKEDFGEGYSRYELSTERVHHHARCDGCGSVIEFNEELMEYLALQVERETGFVTDWHEITLHGRCAACSA
jgi:Fur family ferric uptake transcriptional regulator